MELEKLNNELLLAMRANLNNPPFTEADEVIVIVCSALDLKPCDITGRLKKGDYNEARQIIYKILRDRDYGLARIGEIFGRDHSTVINALNTYDDKVYMKDKVFQAKLALVSAEMEALCV